MAANYYLLLGVTPEANLSQIRRAFRERCKECHPDHDPEGASRFVQIKQAYDTPMDPAERARYDQHAATAPARRTQPRSAGLRSPVDLFRDFETHTPSKEEIIDTFAQNSGRRAPKAQKVHDLNIEMVISPGESMRGGHLSLAIPVFKPCRVCEGTGRTGSAACDECGGAGSTEVQAQVDVIIPRNTRDGTVIPVSLRHLGIRNLYLQVHVREA